MPSFFFFNVISLYTLLTTPSFPVYWSCQFIARVSNSSLKHWQQMGGVNINEDIIIDKSIHSSINSRSSVLKVEGFFPICYYFVMRQWFLPVALLVQMCNWSCQHEPSAAYFILSLDASIAWLIKSYILIFETMIRFT